MAFFGKILKKGSKKEALQTFQHLIENQSKKPSAPSSS
jgi:hypothetical protein